MGGLCSQVRPRYKLYVLGVFDGKSADLCTFAKLYPKQLPQLGRYLLKQLNNRVQQQRPARSSTVLSKSKIHEVKLVMEAWNDLIFTCNDDMQVMEKFILQSMTLLFAESLIQFHSYAMHTLRKYLPFSRKMSTDELLLFVDSCVVLANSDQIPIRTDALKTLSVTFAHLDSQFWPDLLSRFPIIVGIIVRNLDPRKPGESAVFAEHCYEQFCSLISSQNLHVMFKSLAAVVTDHYNWQPTSFVIKLFDILVEHDIEPISIIQETLYFLNKLHSTDVSEETFAEFIDRLTTMDNIVIVLQQFSYRVISKKTNRNPILSKLCALLDAVDVVSLKTDSMDINTERVLQFSRNLLDCIQHYVVDISYIDSQSVLLRMVRQFSIQKSPVHAQLQLQCVLRTLAHRTGKIRSSQRTQDDIIRVMLQFHLQEQYRQESDCVDIIDSLHLSLQNLLLLHETSTNPSSDRISKSHLQSHLQPNSNPNIPMEQRRTGISERHRIGFDETQWAIHRVDDFLESQVKTQEIPEHSGVTANSSNNSNSSSPSGSVTSLTSSSRMSRNENLSDEDWEGMSVRTVPMVQREWIYATIYSYCSSSSELKCDTMLRLTHTILMVAISPHRFGPLSRKVTAAVVDFDILIPFLLLLQKLADQFHVDFIKKSKGNEVSRNKQSNNTVNAHSSGFTKSDQSDNASIPSNECNEIESQKIEKTENVVKPQNMENSQNTEIFGSCKKAIICHSMVLSVMVYIRNFIECHYGHTSNYKVLFHEFNEIIDGVYSKYKSDGNPNGPIFGGFEVQSNGLVTIDRFLVDQGQSQYLPAITHTIPFEKVIQSLSNYFDLLTARRASVQSVINPWTVRLTRKFPVTVILEALCTEEDANWNPSESGRSQSILMSLSQARFSGLGAHSTMSFEDDLLQLNLNLGEGVHSSRLDGLKMIKPLEGMNDFHQISNAYSENARQLDQARHSMTDILPEPQQMLQELCDPEPTDTAVHTASKRSKAFTFSTELFPIEHLRKRTPLDPEFFEARPELMKLRSAQRDYDLNQFYSEHETRMNPSHLLHEGLSTRLGLETLDIETVHDLPDVECELEQLVYGDINEYIYRSYGTAEGYLGIYRPHSIHSPMRQLKTKVNKIKNRTRRLTHHMSVRNIKNTPSAIAQKTKKGSKAIKDGWRTVMSKMKKTDESVEMTHYSTHSHHHDSDHHHRDDRYPKRMGSLPHTLDIDDDDKGPMIMFPRRRKASSRTTNNSTRSEEQSKVRHSRPAFSKGLDGERLESLDDELLSEDTFITDHSEVTQSERSSPRSHGSVNTI